MEEQRYSFMEDGKGMAAEPSASYNMTAQEVQTLRHNVVDAVYASHDAVKLRHCLVFLTQNYWPQEEREEDCNEVLSREQGEHLLRETLVPALRDVKQSLQRGELLPDAHELLYRDDIWNA